MGSVDKKPLVLEIGPGPNPQAKEFPEYTGDKVRIIYMDADPEWKPDVVGDASRGLPFADGALDGIVASHIYEHVSFWKELQVLQDWTRCLKEGGWMHILVPSWEWVARQVLSEKPSPALKPYAFAGQTTPWDVHVNMFTMRQLRSLFERSGLSVVRARTGKRYVNVVGEVHEAEQHYCAGIRKFPPDLI